MNSPIFEKLTGRPLTPQQMKVRSGLLGFILSAPIGWYVGGVGGVLLIAPLPTFFCYAFPSLAALLRFAVYLLALAVGFVWIASQLWGVGK